MSSSYQVTSTSGKTAIVNDIWLDEPDDRDTVRTRRVLRAEIVDNIHSSEERVRASIIHQKRHSSKQAWEDVDAFNLATMKAGEEVRIKLSSAETYAMVNELKQVYAIAEGGVPQGNKKLIVADENKAILVEGRAKGIIQQLLSEAGDDFWQALKDLHPNLFRAVALVKLHEIRVKAIEEFDQHLDADDWDEGNWQAFFEVNTWIFGYGLSYRFLSSIEDQPYYGGKNVGGNDGQRGDFLTAAEAAIRFTVLIEIKKPSTPLVSEKLYRNKVHTINGHLAGGVAQLQSNCHTWEIDGSRNDGNRERLNAEKAFTIQPKGILIVGKTGQLDTLDKRSTFELFRRNLQNPEIITFDELMGRARHLLLNEEKEITATKAEDQ